MQSFGFRQRQLIRFVLVACIASSAAACKQDGPANTAMQSPRGATVAFDTIDGLPQSQFTTLVNRLNDEAQSRRLAVMSRESTSVYRVKGALTATVNKGETTIGWVWDVFDTAQNRVLQIKGEETAKVKLRNPDEAWKVADEAMLQRIAQASMDQLGSFLISPEVAPNVASTNQPVLMPTLAFGDSSPEAAGIYRIRANVDPLADPLAAPVAADSAHKPGA